MTTPETRYARSGDVRIAYQVVGHGSIDLVFVPGFISNLDVQWEDPGFTHFLRRLSAFTRLIVLDKRGTGLSDRVDPCHLPDLQTRMNDIRAVMDEAGSGRAVLLGASEGAAMSILFAAAHPERTRSLLLFGGYAHFHSWVMDEEALDAFVHNADQTWGRGMSLKHVAPDQFHDERFRSWWARFERLSASPTSAITLMRMNARIDVRMILPGIRAPTLVLHRSHDARVRPAAARYLAEHIPGARCIEIPGRDHLIWTGDIDPVADMLEEFITGHRPVPSAHRILQTLLIARIATPSGAPAHNGNSLWSERLDRLRKAATDTIFRYGGHSFGAGSNEFAARFDGSARAVQCAASLRDAADELDIRLATGVHVGEVQVDGNMVAGTAAQTCNRIADAAARGEILVSSVVTDLAAGSGLHFVARGTLQVSGTDDPMRLFVLQAEQHLQPARRVEKTPNLEALSQREREVLGLVAQGLSNSLIAGQLRLSDHTVKRHVANILLKLDLPTRAAAAALLGRRPTA